MLLAVVLIAIRAIAVVSCRVGPRKPVQSWPDDHNGRLHRSLEIDNFRALMLPEKREAYNVKVEFYIAMTAKMYGKSALFDKTARRHNFTDEEP